MGLCEVMVLGNEGKSQKRNIAAVDHLQGVVDGLLDNWVIS